MTRANGGAYDNSATVLAFDPGETTGWCVMRIRKDHLLRNSLSINTGLWWQCGEIDCRQENDGVMQMLDLAKKFPNACIVHEDFIVDMRKMDSARHTLSPVRVTAKFEFGLCMKGMRNKFIIQNRSPVKTTCTDQRLKMWNLYDRHSGPHARDATRHAYYLMRNCCGERIEPQLKRHHAWPHLFEDPFASMANQIRREKQTKKVGERVTGLG